MTDDQAVARLQGLWHRQPEATPWTPVTDYSLEARRAVEGRHPEILESVFGKGPYLDYGCGPEAILVQLLRERGLKAWGDDPLLPKDSPYRPCEQWPSPHLFRVVICREVLEHVPFRYLQGVIQRLITRSEGYIYVTTRFAQGPEHLLDVETRDDLDPTHITMLTKPFLRLLFVLQGCISRPDLEARLDWQGKSRCLVFEVPEVG